MQRYPITPADEQRLSTQHAVTILQLHVVLSTWRRKGVFGPAEGEAIAARWRQMQDELAMAVEKVSFVPDHVHLAVRIHPSVSPATTVVALMNTAQERMWSDFPERSLRRCRTAVAAQRLPWHLRGLGVGEDRGLYPAMGTRDEEVAAGVTIPRTSELLI